MSTTAEARSQAITEAQQRLLDEHQGDTCEYEMGQCLGGCRPACPRSYCTSERHKGPEAPPWPCRVVAPILGFRNAAAYWDAEDAAWLAHYLDNGSQMALVDEGGAA